MSSDLNFHNVKSTHHLGWFSEEEEFSMRGVRVWNPVPGQGGAIGRGQRKAWTAHHQSHGLCVEISVMSEVNISAMAEQDHDHGSDEGVVVSLEELISAHEECMEADESYLTPVFIESDCSPDERIQEHNASNSSTPLPFAQGTSRDDKGSGESQNAVNVMDDVLHEVSGNIILQGANSLSESHPGGDKHITEG